LAIPIG